MENLITIGVVFVILAAVAYFKVPKFKDWVNSKFGKKVEPTLNASEFAVKAPEPVVNTPVPTKPVESIVEAPVKSEAPVFTAPSTPVEVSMTAATSGFAVQKNVQLGTEAIFENFTVPADFSGQIKISVTALDGPSQNARLSVQVLDSFRNLLGPEYSGFINVTVTTATSDHKMYWMPFAVEPNGEYTVAMKADGPAGCIFTVKGS